MPSHRVWGVPNLFVVDGSVLPTQGAANPALVDHGTRRPLRRAAQEQARRQRHHDVGTKRMKRT